MDFLTEIMKAKRHQVADAQARMPLAEVQARAGEVRAIAEPHRFARALRDKSRTNIIAEFKRRSPSKGLIRPDADPPVVARSYEVAGAVAVSVLTEEDHFAGSLDDLRAIKKATSLPVLRKDFIFDEYQVYESAAAGADALLLIVAALDDETLQRLLHLTTEELRMDALVEVHTAEEMARAVAADARIIGVNNRDLWTFDVSIATSLKLASAALKQTTLVSESGLTPEAIRELRAAGYSAFLVGEALMRADDPGKELRRYLDQTPTSRLVQVKICGITSVEDGRAAAEVGADMLGFNFYRPSPRYIEPAEARHIIDQLRSSTSGLTMIGVFVNESSPEAVLMTANAAGVDGIQLHGDESAEFCTRLKQLAPRRLLVKVASASTGDLANYPCDAVMIDAFDKKLRGGTGRMADWALAREAVGKLPRVFLAGGLSPENVGDAIRTVQPYAVDACSSLETSPGRKNARRMKQFVDAVRAAYTP